MRLYLINRELSLFHVSLILFLHSAMNIWPALGSTLGSWKNLMLASLTLPFFFPIHMNINCLKWAIDPVKGFTTYWVPRPSLAPGQVVCSLPAPITSIPPSPPPHTLINSPPDPYSLLPATYQPIYPV